MGGCLGCYNNPKGPKLIPTKLDEASNALLLKPCPTACLGRFYNKLKRGQEPITKPDDKSSSHTFLITNGTVNKPGLSDDYWTRNTGDENNSTTTGGPSQGSMSSISITNPVFEPQGGGGFHNAAPSSEFVNHGLLLWNQSRQSWTGKKRSENRVNQIVEPTLNRNATKDNVLVSTKPFRQPIPLSELVDFLVEMWKEEGLYS